MFFNGWGGIFRVLILGTVAYVAVVVLLRISGKRTLSKMNGFDFVVTVSIGSVLGTVIVSKTVVLAEGLVAIATLVLLQFLITWLSVRINWFEKLIRAEPSLLFSKGEFHRQAMKQQRITEAEMKSAVRAQGIGDVQDAAAVILETDGSLSVIKGSRPPV